MAEEWSKVTGAAASSDDLNGLLLGMALDIATHQHRAFYVAGTGARN
jgi:hypothetical protein